MKHDELRRLAIRLAFHLKVDDGKNYIVCRACDERWRMDEVAGHAPNCPIAELEVEEAASKVKTEEVDDSHATTFSYPIHDKSGRRLMGCEYSSADRIANDGRKLWECRGCAHRTTDPRKGRACDPSEWVERNARRRRQEDRGRVRGGVLK